MRPTLTLKRPDPATKPKVDPSKVTMAESFGWRFIERDKRYILQKLVVSYELMIGTDENGDPAPPERAEISRSWFDVPLVPEVYVG